MNENQEIARKFYSAFQQKDFLTMQSLYHREAQFYDDVFQDLNANEVKAMWEMLLTSSRDLRIEFSDIKQTGEKSTHLRWQAWYTFSRTGRPVHNIIDSRMIFRDGQILDHVDRFNFWRWSRQALGTSGTLLGWTPFLRNKIRGAARKSLDKFMQR
jgi:hypothetical protein